MPGHKADPPPSYLPQAGDERPKPQEDTMGPIGPWATGKVFFNIKNLLIFFIWKCAMI